MNYDDWKQPDEISYDELSKLTKAHIKKYRVMENSWGEFQPQESGIDKYGKICWTNILTHFNSLQSAGEALANYTDGKFLLRFDAAKFVRFIPWEP